MKNPRPRAGRLVLAAALCCLAPACILVHVEKAPGPAEEPSLAHEPAEDTTLAHAAAADDDPAPTARMAAPPVEVASPAGAAPARSFFKLHPIGTVHNPKTGPVELRIDPEYARGLRGLEEWSHVLVFYWFDRNDTPVQRGILQVHPRGNRHNPLTGVFACRAPVRPNLIALTTCKILSVRGSVVTIDRIDAFDGTPILDLKPYSPGLDAPRAGVRVPAWTRRSSG